MIQYVLSFSSAPSLFQGDCEMLLGEEAGFSAENREP